MEFFHSDRTYEQDNFGIEKLCLGLIAALKLQGVLNISINNPDHTHRLQTVQRALRALHEGEDPTAVPNRFPNAPETPEDFITNFNSALLEMEQIKAVEHLGPYFLHLEVSLTEEWSKDILGRFNEPEQIAFYELASAYLEVDEL